MYWRDDKAFYPAEIMGYDMATGRHELEYDDGTPPRQICDVRPWLKTSSSSSLRCVCKASQSSVCKWWYIISLTPSGSIGELSELIHAHVVQVRRRRRA